MDAPALILRIASRRDLGGVDALLARSYPKLLKADYPPSVMVTAVPLLARARPALLASGRYYVAEAPGEGIVGAGGWSFWSRQEGVAEVRHVAVDPPHTRRGVGRRLLETVLAEARRAGMTRVVCLATRTAVPFYEAVGFLAVAPVEIALAPGIGFEAMRMVRPL
ncbi:MAG: GNAT family N-acetyltransferase [Paracoccaceae bacterium]|nr:GNAT family N-acetyltransferase [Paracoccaceae bacterium]